METEEVKAITARVKIQLDEIYTGDNWVTDNLNSRVFSLQPELALKKVAGHNHSVAQLIGHMTAWRNFVVQKLTGNDIYDIEEASIVNWPEPNDWNLVRDEFETCNNNLLSAIDNFTLHNWTEKVPGRNYTFIYLLYGIIQHDYYHYGQIGSVLAALNTR